MKRKSPPKNSLAFTLVEMLTAVALVMVMLVFVVQLSGQTLSATRSMHQQMEASQQGRKLLDSLNADLSNLVAQNGLGVLAREHNGSLELAFLTRSRGPKGATARFLAVAYLLDGNTIVRQTALIDWATAVLPDSPLAAVKTPLSKGIIATGILRFDATMTLDNGDIVTMGSLPNSAVEAADLSFVKLLPSAVPIQSLAPKIQSFTVAVAPLSEQNLNLAKDKDMGTKLGALEDGKTALAVWSPNITPAKLSGVPMPALAGLQLAQQTYEIK